MCREEEVRRGAQELHDVGEDGRLGQVALDAGQGLHDRAVLVTGGVVGAQQQQGV